MGGWCVVWAGVGWGPWVVGVGSEASPIPSPCGKFGITKDQEATIRSRPAPLPPPPFPCPSPDSVRTDGCST
jgi:hypothetical protein